MSVTERRKAATRRNILGSAVVKVNQARLSGGRREREQIGKYVVANRRQRRPAERGDNTGDRNMPDNQDGLVLISTHCRRNFFDILPRLAVKNRNNLGR